MQSKGWQYTTLSEVVIEKGLQIGPFGSQLKASEYVEDPDGIPVVMPKDMANGRIITDSIARVSFAKAKQLKRHLLKAGDIVFGRRGEIGRCALVTEREEGWLCGSGCLRARLCSDLTPEFIAYQMQLASTAKWLESNAVGQTLLNLNTTILSSTPVAFPSKNEQERIAEILATWDEAIALTEKAIEAKQKCKRGFLQQIFKSESYKTFELSEFVDLRREKFNPSPDDDRVCIELEHLSQGTGQLVGSTRSINQNSTKNVFKPEDVLFGKLRPYLRKFANPNFEGVCSTEIWVLKVKPSICNSRYLFYLVQTYEFISIANKTSGSKMPRADWGLVAEHPFPIPLLDEQKKITNFLDSLSDEIMLLQFLKDKLELQKRGLMQKLLTGEWRVAVQEAA
ncbi:restriction endonuclease subunit S [Kamptonema cortianum]|nr:restriction endonuclease subunit S [Kamptonema cortianum]